jgi:hypothetical protein
MPVVLWTLLHRTWALLEANNSDGHVLNRYPLPPFGGGGGPEPPRESIFQRLRRHGPREALRRLLMRLARAVGGGPERLIVHDPRSLEQLRAVRFLLTNLDRLAERRAAVQSHRIRSDADYFRRFPMLRVPTYPGDDRLFSSEAFRSWFPPELRLDDRTLEDIGELTRAPDT